MSSDIASRTELLVANLEMLEGARRTMRKSRAIVLDRTLQRLASRLIAARAQAGITQAEVARLMSTTKSVVSRLESGRYTCPSLSTIEKYAFAVGCSLEISLRASR